MNASKRILIIDFCNFEDYPIGGYLSFAKNFMVSFGTDMALVGITTDKNDPVGKWFKKTINSQEYDFFAYAYYSNLTSKHILPDRLVSYMLIKYYKSQILKINIKNVFIQRQEVLQAVSSFNFSNICYCFAGMENPLAISKYWYAQYLAKYFESKFFNHLKSVKVILASGDDSAIQGMVDRSKGNINREHVHQFPSRINTDIFKPGSKKEARTKLNLPETATIVITTGRLAALKGWKFMIDSFLIFLTVRPGSLLYFIGVGEDLLKMKEYIASLSLNDKVILAGKQDAKSVAHYLNASDLFIMGSYKEGWSTSLIEAIACGKPACVTNFSSAKDIIYEGRNGYVIEEHNVELFSKGMLKAIEIPLPIYNDNVMAYGVNKMKSEILKLWELV